MAAFRRTFEQVAMFLAMFAILFQAFLPAAQAVPWDRSGEGLPDVLIVCSALGARTITIDARQDDPAGTQRNDASAACPICTVHFAKVSVPADDAAAVHVPVRRVVARLGLDGPEPAAADTFRDRAIRAPPGTVS